MDFITKERKYWWLLPLILISIVALILFNQDFNINILEFKSAKSPYIKLFLLFVVIVSLSMLPFYEEWKSKSFHKKLLLIGLTSFLAGVSLDKNFSFQFSGFFALTTLIYLYYERKIYRPSLFHILLIIYFGISALSLLWSSNATLGLSYLGKLTPLLYVSILFCFFELNKRDFEIITHFIFRFSLIFAFVTICSWIVQSRYLNFPIENSLGLNKYYVNGLTPFSVAFAWSNEIHPSYIALNLLLSLCIGWYFLFKKEVIDKVSYFELLVYNLAILLIAVITSSRFMLLGWVFVNTAGFLYVIRKYKNTYRIVTSAMLVLGLTLIFSFSSKITNYINDPIRDCHYNAAFQSINENTWKGTGLGGMTKYINRENPMYAPLGLTEAAEFTHIHPHNQILGDLMQTGIAGIITILLILGVLLYYSNKQKNWILFINIIIFILLMNIEMPLIYLPGIFSFTLYFSFLLSKGFNKKVIYDFSKSTFKK